MVICHILWNARSKTPQTMWNRTLRKKQKRKIHTSSGEWNPWASRWTCAFDPKISNIYKKDPICIRICRPYMCLTQRISKPYVSLMYCHILPYLCEILFRRSLKISLSSSQDGWSTLSAWSAIPRHFPIRKRPPNPRTLPQELGRRIKICINLLILPQVFR